MRDNYFIICSVIYFIKYWEHVKHVLQLITVNQSLFSAFCNLFLWYKLPISYCTCTLETKTKTVVIKVYRMGPHNVVKWFFSNLHYCKSLWNPKSAFWKMNLQNSLYIYVSRWLVRLKIKKKWLSAMVLMFYMLLTKFKFVC